MNDHDTNTLRPGAGRGNAAHPPLETWIDYHAGHVAAPESRRLQGHLAGCRECVDLVLDLDAFSEPAAPAQSRVSDFEKAAVWHRLGPHLESRRWPAVTAVAASLMLAVLGLSAWTEQRRTIAGLETQVSELSRPQVDVMIRDLRPSSRQRSAAGGADSTTELPADSGPITLVLNLEEPVAYPGYELEIVDAEGAQTYRLAGLTPSEFDNFYLNLPPGSLTAGEYELLLFGIAGEERDLLEIYPVRKR